MQKWSSFALGLTIFGTEIGYLLAYWNLDGFSSTSLAKATINAFAIMAVAICGILRWRQSLSNTKLVGLFLFVVGIIFANIK